MSKTLSREEILHIAKLANLTLTDEEIEKYAIQLSEILKYVDKLGEVNTDNVPEMTHTIDSKNIMFEDGTENKRAIFDAKTDFKVNRIM